MNEGGEMQLTWSDICLAVLAVTLLLIFLFGTNVI